MNSLERIRKECQALVDLVKERTERNEDDEITCLYIIAYSAIEETLGKESVRWLEQQGVKLA